MALQSDPSGAPVGAAVSASITVPGHPVSIRLARVGAANAPVERSSTLSARAQDTAARRRELHRIRDLHVAGSLGVPVEALRYARDATGRPQLEHPNRGLDFSVSSTTGLVVVATIAAGARVGIDVERNRALRLDRVRRAFSQREWARIRAADDPVTEALERWTRKEALLKAIGIGLRVPPSSVPSDGAADTPPTTVRPSSVVDPERRRWLVWSTALAAPGFLVACAFEDRGLPGEAAR